MSRLQSMRRLRRAGFAFIAGLALSCANTPVEQAQPTPTEHDIEAPIAIKTWVDGLPDAWRATLAAVEATASAYDMITDTPGKDLKTPEGMKRLDDQVEHARDAVRRLQSFTIQPPNGIVLHYRQYSVSKPPYEAGKRYGYGLLPEADLTRYGIKIVVRFDSSLYFANHDEVSESPALYVSHDGDLEFFSTRGRLVARTKGYLGGRRTCDSCIEFVDPFRRIALVGSLTPIEQLVHQVRESSP